jgi:hypothetical protein
VGTTNVAVAEKPSSPVVFQAPEKPEPMKKGVKVTWLGASGYHKGSGVTIADEDNGNILVAVNTPDGDPAPVVQCAVKDLALVDPPKTKAQIEAENATEEAAQAPSPSPSPIPAKK